MILFQAKKAAGISLAIMFVLVVLADSWVLLMNGIRLLPGGAEVCEYKNTYVDIGYTIMNFFQLIIYHIIPILIIFSCNIFIIIKTKRSKILR